MVGFKHRANDISEVFVIVGKYKTTLGSISHISYKLLHGKQENRALNDINNIYIYIF